MGVPEIDPPRPTENLAGYKVGSTKVGWVGVFVVRSSRDATGKFTRIRPSYHERQAACRRALSYSPDTSHRPAGKLLHHLLNQSRVLDLKAAPQRVEPARREIKRQLAENRCLS